LNTSSNLQHLSVLKSEVEQYLNLKDGEIVVDATLGLGGHARGILNRIGEKGKLIAFEQDERNLEVARERLRDYENQITYIHDNFRYLKTRITGEGFEAVDKALFDLGLSSVHVDQADRGFSFNNDGPLDMRFDPQGSLTAADVLNTYSREDLAKIFFEYGEEKEGHRAARKIVERRDEKNFERTVEFAEFLEKILRQKRYKKSSKSHPATKIFQALRIEVNQELDVLREAIEQIVDLLKVGGRVAIISYHSLEDRIVKKFFKELERPKAIGEEAIYSNFSEPIFKSITKKPVIPSDTEIGENPRSRSAKLRVYEKLKNLSAA